MTTSHELRLLTRQVRYQLRHASVWQKGTEAAARGGASEAGTGQERGAGTGRGRVSARL